MASCYGTGCRNNGGLHLRVEVLHLPPAARALLLGLMIAISGIWVLSDYAGGPTGKDLVSTEVGLKSQDAQGENAEDAETGVSQEGGVERPVADDERAAPLNESEEEVPAAVEDEQVCGGEEEEGAFTFTYWVIDRVIFVLADPVLTEYDPTAVYEWDWGDGTLSYGGPFMSHHYLEPDSQYAVTVARLDEDGTQTHEARQCVEPELYLGGEEIVDRERLSQQNGSLETTDGPLQDNATMGPLHENGHPDALQTGADADPQVQSDLDHWEAWLPGALVAMALVTLVVAVRVTYK